ncbi:MAG: hypothetical protein ACYC1C_18330, partial [Chloroflexota bacterium]
MGSKGERGFPNQLADRTGRLYLLFVLLAAFAVVVMGKLVYIQLMQHDYYRTLADEEHWRDRVIASQRGTILAADGAALAVSVPFETLLADVKYLQDPAKAAELLAPVLGQTKE